MLKRVVRRVGYAGPVRRTITSSSGLGRVTGRFVGGLDEVSAVAVAQRLRAQGMLTTLHVRQGNPVDEAGADAHVELYRRLVAQHVEAGLREGSEISLKMAQFGLLAPGGLDGAVERMRATVADAYAAGIGVTVDMEGIEEVDVTLDAVCRLRADQPDVGIAIQAYLLRSEADCHALASTGARVRLVKGAYGAGPDVAHTTRATVDSAYERCLEILFAGGAYPMVASHDLRMVEAARAMAREAGKGRDAYEIQMLMGVRTQDQVRLAAAGERLRVYVPYGPDWYGWFVNRIVEKPSNVRLLAHALVSPGPRV
ncbi:proline dehydrogenase family protein [Longivirga aurantiaca]|uniref:Proline dehydrogenase family protein n=1 Tax=Longivirga aurantiaca TaxID=1837743 RepID=A0ABW1T1T3_9ACTN